MPYDLITHERRFHRCRHLLNEAGHAHMTVRAMLGISENDYHAALIEADWLDSPHAYVILKAKLALRGYAD